MFNHKKIVSSIALAILSFAAYADDAPPNYIGAMGSYVRPDSNSPADRGYGAHFLYGSPINQWLSIELNGFGHALQAGPGFTGTSDAYGAGVDVRGIFYSLPQADFFALGGLGASYLDLESSGNKGVSPYFDAGLGVVMPIAQNFSFRAEARYYALTSSQIITGQNMANEARFNAGVQFSFGDEPVAQAPVAPPPPPEEVKVVEVDADGDGVLDSADTCPNTPPGMSVDVNGCPLTATPEVSAVVQPVVMDTDGDGVMDDADKCPNTAKGLKVNADGCEEHSIVLKDVNFEFDSARLTENAKDILSVVTDTMKSFDTIKVEIDGHTDDQGTEDYNQGLSERRAAAVKTFLMEHGIKADRMTTKGFGESQPIAPGKSDEARAKNRRVELHVKD